MKSRFMLTHQHTGQYTHKGRLVHTASRHDCRRPFSTEQPPRLCRETSVYMKASYYKVLCSVFVEVCTIISYPIHSLPSCTARSSLRNLRDSLIRLFPPTRHSTRPRDDALLDRLHGLRFRARPLSSRCKCRLLHQQPRVLLQRKRQQLQIRPSA